VLGGIYTQQERDTLTKVPLFGDIPVFGNLFKNNAKTNDKTELLIFLTPRIMSDRLTLR
jgi:type IV pilus assembly protein PilQ